MRHQVRIMLPVALTAAAFLAGCRRGSEAPKAGPLERVPLSANAVVFGERLVDASSSVAALMQRLDGRATPEGIAKDLEQRLGFDPFTAEGLLAAGLDPSGPFAIAIDADGSAGVWVLPVAKADRAAQTIERLARQTEQANRISEQKAGNLVVRTFARPFGSREVPVLSSALVGPHLVIVSGKDGAARAVAVATQKKEQSFAGGEAVKAAAPHLLAAPLRFIVQGSASQGPAEARLASRLVRLVTGGITPSATGIELSVHGELVAGRKDAVLSSLFPKGAALPLLSSLQPDALALGQGLFAFETARQVAESVEPGSMQRIRQQASRVGVELEEAFMAMTDGHFAGAMYLSSAGDIADGFRNQKLAQRQLLRFLPFTFLMRPKAGMTSAALLEKLSERFRARGLTVDKEPEDRTIVRATWPGEPVWRSYRAALVGDVVLVGAGDPARFHAALKGVRGAPLPVELSPETKAALMRSDASTLVLRPSAAAARLDAVMAENLGEGADGLMIKSLVQKVKAFVEKSDEVFLELRPEGSGVRGVVRINLPVVKP